MDEVIVKKIDDLDKDFNRILENLYRQKLFEGIDEKIIIKPNLCTVASLESGIVSDTKLVEDLIKFFKTKKPAAEIFIVESDSFDRDAEEVFARLGYFELQKKLNIRLLNLTKEDSISIVTQGLPYEINLPKIFWGKFFFVSVANLKTHDYQKITCIFKNQFGCIPDRLKERYHPYLEEVLYALDKFIKPDLCIVDGRIALEGNGPVDGEPLKAGVMIIGNKSVAVDSICAQIMGFNPEEVPYLKYAFRKNKYDYKKIKIIGDDLRFNFKFIPKKLYVGIRLKILITRTSVAITNFLKKLSFHILYFGIIQTFSRIPGYIKKQIVKQ